MKVKTFTSIFPHPTHKNRSILDDVLHDCFKEVLGLTDEQIYARWKKAPPPTKNIPGKKHGHSAYGPNKSGRKFLTPTVDALVPHWYQTRDPDWLYNDPEYFWEGLACSYCTSVGISTNIPAELYKARYASHPSINYEDLKWNIYDWGAGVGLTTLILAKNFKNSTVYYNEINPEQRAAFKYLLEQSGITNVVDISHLGDDLESVPGFDLVSAIEIVEHFQEPMSHVDTILSKINKGGFFCHSSYWQAELKFPTLGHFLSYDIDGKVYSPKRVNRAFTTAMSSRGFTKLKWDPYGHKPHFYYKGPATDWPHGEILPSLSPGYKKLKF